MLFSSTVRDGERSYMHVPWCQQVPKLVSEPRDHILAPQLWLHEEALIKMSTISKVPTVLFFLL